MKIIMSSITIKIILYKYWFASIILYASKASVRFPSMRTILNFLSFVNGYCVSLMILLWFSFHFILRLQLLVYFSLSLYFLFVSINRSGKKIGFFILFPVSAPNRTFSISSNWNYWSFILFMRRTKQKIKKKYRNINMNKVHGIQICHFKCWIRW